MRIPVRLGNSMQYPIKTLALQTVELTFATALMASLKRCCVRATRPLLDRDGGVSLRAFELLPRQHWG